MSERVRRGPTHRLATLGDVAALAGVSKATASKALADRYDVSAETRARVVSAAAELRFRPNALARTLGNQRSESVGLITSDMTGRFAPPIMQGAEDAFGADRSSVFLCNSRGDDALEAHHVEELLKRRVDGIIVVGDIYRPRPPLSQPIPVPVVYVYAPSTSTEDVSVVSDNRASGRIATQTLIDGGRRRIAHLGGHPEDIAAQDRAAGMDDALRAAGLAGPPGTRLFRSWSEHWGWTGVDQLLDTAPDIDGIVCGDDHIGHGAVLRLEQRGVAVPDEIAVIGFDDWDVVNADSRLPFPSVDMRLGELGRQAARALMDGDLTPGLHAIPGTVVGWPRRDRRFG